MSEKIKGSLNPLSDGEFILDKDGFIVDISLRTELVLGRPRSEMIGKRSSLFVTFSNYHTTSEEVIASDAQYYKELINKGHEIETIIRPGFLITKLKERDAKFAILPMMIAQELNIALMFVFIDIEDETSKLQGIPKTLVLVGDWFITLWKSNTTAAIALITSTILILTIVNAEKLSKIGLDLTPGTPNHPKPSSSK
jgi:hypothetical protein